MAGLGISMGTSRADIPTDDYDEEEDIIFEVEFSKQAMRLEGRKHPRAMNGDEEGGGDKNVTSMFEPDTDIEPTGWDSSDVPQLGNPLGGDALGATGLHIVSVGGDINVGELIKDITTQNIPSMNGKYAGRNDLNSTDGGSYPKEPSSSSKRANPYVDEDDDVDRRKEEECVPNLYSHYEDMHDTDDAHHTTESPLRFVEMVEAEEGKIVSESDKPVYPTEAEIASAEPEAEETQIELMDFKDQLSIPPSLSPGFKVVDESVVPKPDDNVISETGFSFHVDAKDEVPYGPNPCLILQALTMSNANDGINLERLETVGDSFLKYAITAYLFNTPDGSRMHEGKLSFLRSKLVSNYNLYRLGKRKGIGELMVAAKFEPSDNWLPPGFCSMGENVVLEADMEDMKVQKILEGEEDIEDKKEKERTGWDEGVGVGEVKRGVETVDLRLQGNPNWSEDYALLPYNILSQHSVPDKSLADAVEALIGAYLLTYGPPGAKKFMEWLGLKVMEERELPNPLRELPGGLEESGEHLCNLWEKRGFSQLEKVIGYTFRQKAYLIQAFTHASYYYNRVTDCYQRLEFLGDAVLDYMITRHLYEDKRSHSPGVLTDLRSALVNNTIFASLAVKYDFHKYFLAMCPPLDAVIQKFVNLYREKQTDANFDEELVLFTDEDTCEDEEDIEVPKALGDIFESVAGAIYMDSGRSLDTVWGVYYKLMKPQLEKCAKNPPKSPIRELLEMEPETAKFSKLERIVTEGKVRVTVDITNKGRFTGMARNYRIAKCTAAKRALRYLRALKAQQQSQKNM